MLRFYIAEIAQNPKVGMVVGGIMTSTGVAVSWFDVAKDWLGFVSILVGIVLSIFAIAAQRVRIKNDKSADRRAEELHQEQLKKLRAGDGNPKA